MPRTLREIDADVRHAMRQKFLSIDWRDLERLLAVAEAASALVDANDSERTLGGDTGPRPDIAYRNLWRAVRGESP